MRKRIFLLIAGLSLLFAFSTPALVSAETAKEAACAGVGSVSGGNGCVEDPNGPTVNKVISVTINALSVIVGVAAVIMIIIGGFKFITAGGDSGKVASARDTIMYSIIGLVVAALAQVIVKFVLNKL